MISYLGAWLMLTALPLGALPLLMAHELRGGPQTPVTLRLRALLMLLPLGALAAIPLMLGAGHLYSGAIAGGGALARWMAPAWLIGRLIGFLIVWLSLAALFLREPRARRNPGWIGAALFLHVAITSVAAMDWAMMVAPGLGSSAFGLLVIAAQATAALAAAILLAGRAAEREAARLLSALLAGWVFLHFIQYLTIWSADLPGEITWYLDRAGGLGRGVAALIPLSLLAVLLLVLLPVLARQTRTLTIAAALVLATQVIGMFWLVTPSARHRFIVAPSDWLAFLVLVVFSAAGVRLSPRALPLLARGHDAL
jgi:hypothetical protein